MNNQNSDKNLNTDTLGSSVLKSVTKPGRYAGGEYGQIVKDKANVKARLTTSPRVKTDSVTTPFSL